MGKRLIASPGLGLVWLLIAACRPAPQEATITQTLDPLAAGTADPIIAQTLQADAAVTAAGIATPSEVSTPTEEPFPTAEEFDVEGIAPRQRTGTCEAPDGFVVHQRDGFCLAAPETWTVLNVDGGLAAFLETTPGKALTLMPDWARSAEVCSLLVYISTENSVSEHLDTKFFTFASRDDLVMLSNVRLRAIGGLALRGFTWEATSGASGRVYADLLGSNRLVHLSFTGSDCPAELLEPVIETIRFNE